MRKISILCIMLLVFVAGYVFNIEKAQAEVKAMPMKLNTVIDYGLDPSAIRANAYLSIGDNYRLTPTQELYKYFSVDGLGEIKGLTTNNVRSGWVNIDCGIGKSNITIYDLKFYILGNGNYTCYGTYNLSQLSSYLNIACIDHISNSDGRTIVYTKDINGDGLPDFMVNEASLYGRVGGIIIHYKASNVSLSQNGTYLLYGVSLLFDMPETENEGASGAEVLGASADQAKIAAQAASTNALNAYNMANSNSSYLTNGTYGLNAIKTQVNNANANASNAYSRADSNYSTLNNGTYGLSALSSKLVNLDTKTNNIDTKISNMETQINNIETDIDPSIVKIYGENNATCTTTSQFKVRVLASNATQFRVKPDTGSWSSWMNLNEYAIANGIVGDGIRRIDVEVRNEDGDLAVGSMCIFKL